jgi:glutamate:GABA antiporter
LRDIVLINITAIIGPRWLPIAAGYGASSIMLWLMAAAFLFIPLGLVSAELATAWPEEGGLYVWIREAYGRKAGFLVSWFYWVNTFFSWPSLFTFIAITLAYLINPALATHKFFICSIVIISLWFITLINLINIKVFKVLSNLAGILGTILPGLVIIGLGFYNLFLTHGHIPTDYSLHSLLPSFGANFNIAMLSTLMFAMAGIEITPILAGETHNPQKTFPRATLISAIVIVAIYVIGTMAITFVIAPDKIGSASGIMETVMIMAKQLNLMFIIYAVGLMLCIGNLGGASIWLVGSTKILLESAKGGILPRWLVKVNPKNQMPERAMIIQACGVSTVVIGTSFLPSVNVFYETLVIMATIIYFVPYFVMFLAFLKLRRSQPEKKRPYKIPGGKFAAWLVCGVGLTAVVLAIVLPFIVPPQDIGDSCHKMIYRLELLCGMFVFALIGYLIYRRYERLHLSDLKKVE